MRVHRVVAAGVVAGLVGTLSWASPAAAEGADRLRWTAEDRRAHGLQEHEKSGVELDEGTIVPATEITTGGAGLAQMPVDQPQEPQWPDPVQEIVEVLPGGSPPQGGDGDVLPVRVRAAEDQPAGGQVRVQVLDRAAAERAEVEGILVTVSPIDPGGSGASASARDRGKRRAGTSTPERFSELSAPPAPEPALDADRQVAAVEDGQIEGGPVGESTAAPTEEDAPVTGDVADSADAPGSGENSGVQAVTEVTVEVDYSDFAGAIGGDWASRLRLVAVPACAATTPASPACRERIELESVNDPVTQTVSASFAPSNTMMLAVTSAPSGGAGNWAATPLSPSAAWQVSAQTGDFSWSYPISVVPGVGGPQPELALNYSSGSLDGRVASTNNQSSWVGDGWDLTDGYVERKYVTCNDDVEGSPNNKPRFAGDTSRRTGDLCWGTDNAMLVLNGSAMELVKDAATGLWRVKHDDATKVEQLTRGWNTARNGEYWKVTTADGTQYFFGRERRWSTDASSHSAWTVPVFGNHSGEPCYDADYAQAWCTQGWRWNLDYVRDVAGNSAKYTYAKETNNYGRNLNKGVSNYVAGGHLVRIEYGHRVGAESPAAPARVEFTVSERCLPSGTITCAPSQLTAANATHWPDVPFDQICTSTTSCPSQVYPAFFSRKRLAKITTQVLSGTTYRDVDAWTLHHTFPDPGDGTNASLFLHRISRQGLAGGTASVPDVQFTGTQMANRVDRVGDLGPAMNRYRITSIRTESGGVITVGYTGQDCSPSSLPAARHANTRRCFPVMWSPAGSEDPIEEYFHKYLVRSIVADPRTGPAGRRRPTTPTRARRRGGTTTTRWCRSSSAPGVSSADTPLLM